MNTTQVFNPVTGKFDLVNSDYDVTLINTLNQWYGVSRKINLMDTELTRIAGDMTLHHAITGLPVQQLMRRCLVDSAGNVTYLHSTNSNFLQTGAPAILDGSMGNVMVEIPEHYVKFWVSGDYENVAVSMYALPGYTKVAKHYISAYEAALNRTTGRAMSVVNTTAEYRGGNNTSDWDAAANSLLGKPVTKLTRPQERAASALNGEKWCEEPFEYFSPWRWLAIIEFANTNIQAPINTALTVNGYRQGGLGNGVTTASSSDWGTFNSYNPFIPCGVTNSLGNQSGEISYNAIDFKGVGVNQLFMVPSYRGIENPFGHIFKRIEGININRTDDNVQVYVKGGVSGFSDNTSDNYIQVGNLPYTSGYILNLWWGNMGIFLPKEIGGGTTTSWCDYYYAPTTNGWTGPLSSASAYHGARAGLAYVYAYSASIADMAIGFRLCFKP